MAKLTKEVSLEDHLRLRKQQARLAFSVRRLKSSTMRVVDSKEYLPQPLFWSLFHLEVNEIKKRKQHFRIVRQMLYGIES